MLNNLSAFTMATTELISSPVSVPADYVGFHFHRYPNDPNPTNGVSNSSPEPTITFGSVRTHDNGRCAWRQLNPSQGVYYWDKMDEFMASFANKTLTFTLYGTPTWACSPADAVKIGLYGAAGEGGMPTTMSYITDFMAALFARYPGQIDNFEVWNEPTFTQDNSGFWWGSLQDMLLVAKTCYDWIKANQPTVKVFSPGFFHGHIDVPTSTPAYQFLNTSIGRIRGIELCDAISIHPYTMFYSGTTNSRGITNHVVDMRMNSLYTSLLIPSLVVTTKPIYITEWGVGASPSGQDYVNYTKLSKDEQVVLTWRMMVYCAIKQIKGFYMYGYDNALSGNWCSHQGRTINADLVNMINEFNTAIAGKTINTATRFHDGRLMITLSTGEQYCK